MISDVHYLALPSTLVDWPSMSSVKHIETRDNDNDNVIQMMTLSALI